MMRLCKPDVSLKSDAGMMSLELESCKCLTSTVLCQFERRKKKETFELIVTETVYTLKHRLLCSMLWPLNAADTKEQHPFIIRRQGTGGVSHNQDNEWFRVMVVKLQRATASQSGAGSTAISRTKHLNKTSCFHFGGKTFFFPTVAGFRTISQTSQ